jgi:TatD DNase family protein
VGVWLSEVNARDVSEAARAKDSDSPQSVTSLLSSLRALAGPRCEAIIGLFADAGEVSPTVGDGSKYGAWLAYGDELQHAAFGLEPRCSGHISASESDPVLSDLLELWRSPLCVARGPMGLDYTIGGEEEWESQRHLFARLLSLGGEEVASKPLLVCCRGGDAAERAASELIVQSLQDARGGAARPSVCCHDAGLLWSRLAAARLTPFQIFDGALTFTKAHTLHELAFDVPLDRLLLASGSPRNLPTQAHGGRRTVCHPGHITFTVERLAEIKRGGVEVTEVLEASRANARAVFGV